MQPTATPETVTTTVDLLMQCLANNVNHPTSFELMEGVPVIEGKMLGKKLLAMVEKMTKEDSIQSWQYRFLRENYEASLCCFFAMLNADSAEEGSHSTKKLEKSMVYLALNTRPTHAKTALMHSESSRTRAAVLRQRQQTLW
jgi:hypothetical protein